MPSADAGPNPELIDFRRRLWIGAPLALAVLVLEMGGMMGLPWADWFGGTTVRWLQFLLAKACPWYGEQEQEEEHGAGRSLLQKTTAFFRGTR